jgi:hypothetical protein
MVKQEELTIRRTHEPVGNHQTQPISISSWLATSGNPTQPKPDQNTSGWVTNRTEPWNLVRTPNDSNNNNALLMALFIHCRSNFKISNQFSSSKLKFCCNVSGNPVKE